MFWTLFFPSKILFKLANSHWSIKFRKPVVSLIVRAKKNFVAYFEAEVKPGAKGRPRKYGEKIVLMELFDHMEAFEKSECSVYGKTEEVSALAINLLWRPTGDLIRFVLARTSRGPIVLMSNDLQIAAGDGASAVLRENANRNSLRHAQEPDRGVQVSVLVQGPAAPFPQAEKKRKA